MASELNRWLRTQVRAFARRLPPPRGEAVLTMLRSARTCLTGRKPAPPTNAQPDRTSTGRREPGPPLPPVDKIPVDYPWQDPPISKRTGLARSLYSAGTDATRYDVALLEQLNDEYKDRPIVPNPRSWSSEDLGVAARRRVEWAHNQIDLKNKTVLEVGCDNGYEVWSMAHNLGCNAYGVDVIQPNCWDDLTGDRVHLACVDLTEQSPFDDNTFDRIISFTVWEHVVHPHRLLTETFRILKPGGLKWIRANLWAGPQASHRYREIYFPWPHLLFSDDVIKDWDAQRGRTPKGSAWVNKLSWHHYESYFEEVGYRLRSVKFQHADWDEGFYIRYQDVLGRIPRTDLRRDYFTAVLEKPGDA